MQSQLRPRLVILLLPILTAALQIDDNEFPNLDKIVLPPATQSRVVGGDAITAEKLGGFMVALRYKSFFMCGASLVDKRVLVTAAHCFLKRPEMHEWTAQGGMTRLSEPGDQVPLLDFVTPSSFDSLTMHMDVAVVYLSKALKGPYVNRINICSRPLVPGTLLTVAGWGLAHADDITPQPMLRAVTVPIIKKAVCKRTYRDAVTITDSMFCAGHLGRQDACLFDSGGPFFYTSADGQKELCGIVSFGIGCASPKYPGVYTDVNYAKPFIVAMIDKYRKRGIE